MRVDIRKYRAECAFECDVEIVPASDIARVRSTMTDMGLQVKTRIEGDVFWADVTKMNIDDHQPVGAYSPHLGAFWAPKKEDPKWGCTYWHELVHATQPALHAEGAVCGYDNDSRKRGRLDHALDHHEQEAEAAATCVLAVGGARAVYGALGGLVGTANAVYALGIPEVVRLVNAGEKNIRTLVILATICKAFKPGPGRQFVREIKHAHNVWKYFTE
jgi:hypothetical protein